MADTSIMFGEKAGSFIFTTIVRHSFIVRPRFLFLSPSKCFLEEVISYAYKKCFYTNNYYSHYFAYAMRNAFIYF